MWVGIFVRVAQSDALERRHEQSERDQDNIARKSISSISKPRRNILLATVPSHHRNRRPSRISVAVVQGQPRHACTVKQIHSHK